MDCNLTKKTARILKATILGLAFMSVILLIALIFVGVNLIEWVIKQFGG